VAAICEASGANIDDVAGGMGADKRIGREFLNAGLGYGGSCFPKDIKAFIAISRELGVPFALLEQVEAINAAQLQRFLGKIRDALWVLKEKRIGVLGLAFKANTDDVRSSVAVALCRRLIEEGARVSAYDPQAMARARPELPEAVFCEKAQDVFQDAEAVVIATEWKAFRALPWARLKERMVTPLVFDGRNVLDAAAVRRLGYRYFGVGRG
jgi:UDPglucose 6-dehydrogenase